MRSARILAAAAAVVVIAAGCARREPAATPRPSPKRGVPEAAATFRRAVADALQEAAVDANVQIDPSALAAVTVGDGMSVAAVVPVRNAARLTGDELDRGAEVMLVFLPPTSGSGLEAAPYVVRTRRSGSATTAQLVGLDGSTAAEIPLTFEEPAAGAASDTCRVSIDRSSRRIAIGTDCGTYVARFTLDEELGTAPEPTPPVGPKLASANKVFRRALADALCDEARARKIADCPTQFIAGSRRDSLAVSAALVGSERVPTDRLRSGIDTLLTYLDLPAELGIPRGFATIRRSARPDGSWVSQTMARDGRILHETTPTVTRSAVGTPPTTERYVSYLDSTVVCVDLDIEVYEVETGNTYIETEITCYGRVAPPTGSPSPTAETARRATARPTARPPTATPRITASPSPSPAPTATASPTAPATASPSPSPVP